MGCHVCGDHEAILGATLDVDFVFPAGKGDVRETGEEDAVSVGE